MDCQCMESRASYLGLETYDSLDAKYQLLIITWLITALLTYISTKFQSKIRYHGNENIVDVDHPKYGRIRFDELLKISCPDMFSYSPTPYLFNHDLQTITAAAYKVPFCIDYEEQHWRAPDGGTIAVHFYPKMDSILPHDIPFVVLFHGLTGHSREPYIKTIVKDSQYPDGTFRYRCAVIHGRGCGGATLTSPQTHAPGYTGDARLIIDRLRRKFTYSPFVLIGFSLGANVMINYVGEEGESLNEYEPGRLARVCGAISLGNPFDIFICSHSLESTLFRKLTYAKKIAKKLTKYFGEAINDIWNHPSIPPDEVVRAQTPRQFDDRVTRRIFGYPTVNQYYRECGCCHRIVDVCIPTLFINSTDDPISVINAIPYDECQVNPFTMILETNKGGHCGWYTGWNPRYWFNDYMPALIQTFAQMRISNLEIIESIYKSIPMTEQQQVFEKKKKSNALVRRLSDRLSQQQYDSSESEQIQILYEVWKDLKDKGF